MTVALKETRPREELPLAEAAPTNVSASSSLAAALPELRPRGR